MLPQSSLVVIHGAGHIAFEGCRRSAIRPCGTGSRTASRLRMALF